MLTRSWSRVGAVLMALSTVVSGCAPKAGSGDAAFKSLADEILKDGYQRHPTQATTLGVHT